MRAPGDGRLHQFRLTPWSERLVEQVLTGIFLRRSTTGIGDRVGGPSGAVGIGVALSLHRQTGWQHAHHFTESLAGARLRREVLVGHRDRPVSARAFGTDVRRRLGQAFPDGRQTRDGGSARLSAHRFRAQMGCYGRREQHDDKDQKSAPPTLHEPSIPARQAGGSLLKP